jgi:hypothetical protein
MKLARLGSILLAVALALACSSTAPPQSSYDHEANFGALKTFGWYADPAEDKGVGSAIVDTRFVEVNVKKDVTEVLKKKGFQPAAADATPDFFADYHTRAAGILSRDVYGAYAWWSMPVYMGTQSQREAVLAIDFRDGNKKLIWRGWVSKLVGSSPEKIARQIRSSVEEILAKFPPAPGQL